MRHVDPELARYHQDLYASALDAGDLLTRCQAALLIAPAGSYISHFTAARLQGLRVPDSAAIDVSVLPGRCRVLGAPLAMHRGHPDARTRRLAGLRVSDPVQVALELARTLRLPHLVGLFDSIVEEGSVTRADLATAYDLRPGRLRRFEDALALAVPGVQSLPESLVRVLLVLAGLRDFVVQHPVKDPLTGATYLLDLAFPRWRVAVEYDGKHHLLPEQRAADEVRRGRISELLGWRFVVVNAEELYGAPGDVLSRAALAINDQSGVAPRLDPAWRDYFTEHASRHWSPESPQPSA
ncbi:MAG: hypothetical protein M9891_12635 [Austwickia sp.]|nr:hypothetical protein [Tetrasphaera sp.]MCO5310113.1 hypothetical protein [Austwickia sp.]